MYDASLVIYYYLQIISCSTLDTYEETPIFIPVDITEDSVESVAQMFWGVLSLEVQTQKHYRGGG